MAKGGSSAPPTAPDPVATSNAQAQANTAAVRESAKVNAVDIYGPYGSTTYDRDANGVPIAQNTTLTPINQQTLNTQNQIGLTLANKAKDTLTNLPTDQYSMATSAPYDPRAVSTEGLTIWGAAPDDFAYDPNSYGDVRGIDAQAADAVFANAQRQLTPVFDQQRERLEQQLHDRGLPIDGVAYDTAMSNLNRDQGNIWAGVTDQAYLTGHQVAGDNINREQQLRSNAVNESMTFANQGNADWLQRLQTEQGLRTQIQGEDIKDRERAFNEASAYLQGSPVFGTPSAPEMPSYQIAPAPIAQATYNSHGAQMDIWGAKQKQQQAMWQTLGQAAGAAGVWAMSSKALKIELGDADSYLARVRALPIRHWRYKDPALGEGDMLGPWAEDFSQLFGGPTDRISMLCAIFILWRAVQELAEGMAGERALT